MDAACGHFLQALTPDTRLTVMLLFYPGHSTRSIIGVFRAYAIDVASTSDLWHDKDLLVARVNKVRRIPAGNQEWGAFCALLHTCRDPDRHCAQTLLSFLAAWDRS